MFKFWWFPDPIDSVCELSSDSGWKAVLQQSVHPSGRIGQYCIVPNTVPDSWGANIITAHPDKITLNLRGILSLGVVSQLAQIAIDDVTLPDSHVVPPIPPTDEIDLSKVVVYNSPQDIASWLPTLIITEIVMDPKTGWAFKFNREVPDSWKWMTGGPPGDNYQYTVWPVIYKNGAWYSSGIVQMWQGRESTGPFEMPTWHEDFHKNWCYEPSWGQMFSYFPNPGDKFGFFVSAGNARFEEGVTSVRERSNVVEFILPPDDKGVFPFAAPK